MAQIFDKFTDDSEDPRKLRPIRSGYRKKSSNDLSRQRDNVRRFLRYSEMRCHLTFHTNQIEAVLIVELWNFVIPILQFL
jgi:hypothetical protein